MSRDVDLFNLEGVIFDHACGLDPYILKRYNVLLCNDLKLCMHLRKPREFEFLRCLVDGSHWQGQKRLRKPDRQGKGGHLGYVFINFDFL